jgi:hypothetical protein
MSKPKTNSKAQKKKIPKTLQTFNLSSF